jgi:hypothetical protein
MLKFCSALAFGPIVQVVTDYSVERMGRLKYSPFDDDEYIQLEPYDNKELMKILNEVLDGPFSDYKPSVPCTTLINMKTIKEIVILKHGQNINVTSSTAIKSEETSEGSKTPDKI